MLLFTGTFIGIALASAPVQMDWTESSATDPSISYRVSLYGLGEDDDGDGRVDEVSLFFQVTTLQDGRPVLHEEGLVQVDQTLRAYADAEAGRAIVLQDGTLVLSHGDQVAPAGGDLWLFENS